MLNRAQVNERRQERQDNENVVIMVFDAQNHSLRK